MPLPVDWRLMMHMKINMVVAGLGGSTCGVIGSSMMPCSFKTTSLRHPHTSM